MSFAVHEDWKRAFGDKPAWYRVCDHFDLINGFPFRSDGFNLDGRGKPLVRIRDLLSGDLPTFFDGDEGCEVVVRDGDIAIGMDGDFNSVTWVKGEALLNQRVCALRAKENSSVETRILGYQIPISLKVINDLTPWSTVKHLSSLDVLSLRFPLFDLSTQRRIADFLDRETARIDLLIEKKKRLVVLLGEREEGTFTEHVTGKDLSCEKKHSGVDWIGEIPGHWFAPKFTQIARQETGHTPSRKVEDYWVPEECLIPWVSLADVWQIRGGQVIYISETSEKISEVGMANSSARLLPKDTVILSRTASVGFPAIMSEPMATTQDFAAWICGKRMRPLFLYYVLRSMKPVFRRLMMGSTHQTIYMPDIRSFRTPLPPIHEQDEIVSRLSSTIQTFRDSSAALSKSIDRLKEYRSALITAAVTGQIDVETYAKSGTTDHRLDAIQEEMGA